MQFASTPPSIRSLLAHSSSPNFQSRLFIELDVLQKARAMAEGIEEPQNNANANETRDAVKEEDAVAVTDGDVLEEDDDFEEFDDAGML